MYHKNYLFDNVLGYCELDSSAEDDNGFDLYISLKNFLSWCSKLPYDDGHTLSLPDLFYSFIIHFLKKTMIQNVDNIEQVLKNDPLTPISELKLYSSSASQLFTLFETSYEILLDLEAKEASFIGQYAEVIILIFFLSYFLIFLDE